MDEWVSGQRGFYLVHAAREGLPLTLAQMGVVTISK